MIAKEGWQAVAMAEGGQLVAKILGPTEIIRITACNDSSQLAGSGGRDV